MMTSPQRFVLTLPLLAALLAGCGKTPNGPAETGTTQDQSDVASTLSENPSLVDDEVSESSDQTQIAASAQVGLGTDAAITPNKFWRQILDVQRRFDFAFSDPDSNGRPMTAVVTVHRTITGNFNIEVSDPLHVIHKPLVDHAVRRLRLRRVPVEGRERGIWRVVATSGIEITSRNAISEIDSVNVQSGALDTTITNPLDFFRLRHVMQIDPGAQVTITAYTKAQDDVVLLYTLGSRERFADQGNVHTISFTVPDVAVLRHIGVNALSHGTLYDDAAPYDSKAWIEPYVVHPLTVAADTPDQ